jgi:hypothetical protein
LAKALGSFLGIDNPKDDGAAIGSVKSLSLLHDLPLVTLALDGSNVFNVAESRHVANRNSYQPAESGLRV